MASAVKYFKSPEVGLEADEDLDVVEFDVTHRAGLAGMVDITRELYDHPTRTAVEQEVAGNKLVPHSSPYQTMEEETKGETFSIETAIDSMGFGWFQWKVSILCGFAWMADAMEMMILSIISPALHCAWGIASWKQALITTVVFLGMMGGAAMWGSFSDKYGRKVELIFSSAVTLYYGILSAFSPTLAWMLLLRALVGFGVSGGAQSVTLYSEFLPTKTRARAIVCIEIFFALGTAFEVALAFIVMPTLGWRWLLAFSAMPLLLFCIACKWLPESVRYSVTKGNNQDAMETLKRISKSNGKPMPSGTLVQHIQTGKRGRIMDLFSPKYRRTTLLLWVIWFANAFCYYGIVLLTTELFELEKGGDCSTLTAEAIAGPACTLDCHVLTGKDYADLLWTTLAEVPGLLITLFAIDRLGRKLSMAMEFIVFAVFVFVVSFCPGRTAEIVFIFIGRAFISGAFQVAFVYTPEIYPTEFRAVGLGVASTFARLGAVITPFIAQVLIKTSLRAAVGIYAAVAVIAAVCCILLPIETKGKSLAEESAK